MPGKSKSFVPGRQRSRFHPARFFYWFLYNPRFWGKKEFLSPISRFREINRGSDASRETVSCLLRRTSRKCSGVIILWITGPAYTLDGRDVYVLESVSRRV